VFTKDLDLPRGRERGPVRERDRVYEVNGSESRMLGTIGAFRVLSESDLHDLRGDSPNTRQSVRHLENEELIRTTPLSSDDRAVVLTEHGRDLLEANRYEHHARAHDPRQAFYAGLKKPRELTHDAKVYRAYQRAEERLRGQGARVNRVVLDYELKRDYQRFLQERNRGRKDSDGRPDREPEEIARWAREHDLPYDDEHVHFPDARIEYEDRDGCSRHEDIEVVTGHYRGAHAGAAARSGFTCYRVVGGLVGGRGGGGRRTAHPRIAEEFLR
jgi:DNA-binding MarR family transcriptional regulator